jgi:hypothetical protein
MKNQKEKIEAQICEAADSVKAGWPAFMVVPAHDCRGLDEHNAWEFDLHLTYADGRTAYQVWKIIGWFTQREDVYGQMRERAAAREIVKIEICDVSPPLTGEALKERQEQKRNFNHGLTQMEPMAKEQKAKVESVSKENL